MSHHRIFVWLAALWVAGQFALPGAEIKAASSCSPGTYVVSQNTNARTGASTEARIVTTVSAGLSVQVVGERLGTLVGSSGLWCEVSLNGQSAFIHSGALTLQSEGQPASEPVTSEVPAPDVEGQSFRVVGSNSVNGRSAPNTSASIMAAIPAGINVVVTGQESGARVSGSDVWYIVAFDGKSVYVHSSLLSPVAPVAAPPASPEQPIQPQTEQTAPKGDGTYLVGTEIATGHWTSLAGSDSCYWERQDANGRIIDNHFGESGGYVHIWPSDHAIEFWHCGDFYYVDGQPPVLQPDGYSPHGDGFYRVGQEIGSGNWRTTGSGNGCYWARLNAFQEIIENSFGGTWEKIYVAPTDFELYVSGCGDIVYEG
jgi:uncharacterized protein YgiM (DUF1202 family)